MEKRISKIENEFRKYISSRDVFFVKDTKPSNFWSIFCAKTNRPFIQADIKRMHVVKHKQEIFARLRKRWDAQMQKSLEVQTQGKIYKVSVQHQLDKVVSLLPSSGYSMGEMKYAHCTHTDNEGSNDNTYKYKGEWRGSERYGSVYVSLKPSELLGYKDIHGVWTKITKRQKNGIHKCRCIIFQWEKPKSKNNGYVQKVVKDMYLVEFYSKIDNHTYYYHANTKEEARRQMDSLQRAEHKNAIRERENRAEEKKHNKKVQAWAKSRKRFITNILKKEYTFQDSRNSGNCEVGTLQFCHRHHFDRDVKLSGRDLIRFARIDEDLRFNIKRILHHASGFYSYSKERDEFNDYLDMLIDKVKIS